MNYKYASLHNFSARIITAAMFAAVSVKGNLFQVAKLNYSAADQSKDTKSCVDTLRSVSFWQPWTGLLQNLEHD